MAFAADLLDQAQHLAQREPKRPKLASLRRSISTAYYALVHLLIAEATLNWKREPLRPFWRGSTAARIPAASWGAI